MTTKRLPIALKKKLQASLETLTAKEAGRLFAIYALEADRKKKSLEDYPPIQELWEAMQERINRSRGKPDQALALNRYNGMVFLVRLRSVINYEDGLLFFVSLMSDAIQAGAGIALLLQEDATAEMIRFIRSRFHEEPSPVTREDYILVMDWGRTRHLYPINDAANLIADHEDDEGRDFHAVYDDLAARLKAGELEGGEGFFVNDIDSPVLIEDGTIPAWAALCATWRRYVGSVGLHIFDLVDVEEWAPSFVDRVGNRDGEALADKDLRKLATAFYKDCRRRPWGKGLVAKPDVDDLVKLLTQSANPFLHIKPFDFGRVDWEAFRKNETDRHGEPYEIDLVATEASLGRLDAQVTRGQIFDGVAYMQEQFYPVTSVEWARRNRASLFAMMAKLDTTRQPFSFDRLEKDMMTMSELMGIKFLTPLEKQVENLRLLDDQAASLKAAVKVVSDRYFGGLPILVKDVQEILDRIDHNLTAAKQDLSRWVETLKRWPWNIDTSAMEVGEPEVDEDFVAYLVARFIDHARAASRIKDPESVLFEEDGSL